MGIRFKRPEGAISGPIEVTSVLPNSAAERSGQLRAGDFFCAIDGQDVSTFDDKAVAGLFRGAPSTTYTLSLCAWPVGRTKKYGGLRADGRQPVSQAKQAIKGCDVSKQWLDAATKTGIFTVTGKRLKEFPKECLQVANLRVLALDHCDLQQVSPEIGSLVSLQKLVLPNNKLRALPPQLSALSALQQIDLRCNLLGTLPDCFSVMHKLKELVLGNNLLETLPESVSAASSLKLLDVSNNKLQALPACLGDLLSLEDLDCSFNFISHLPHQ